MKIAWLINGHAGSGGGRIIIKIANELIRRGYDLTFYAQDGGGIDFMSKAPTLPLKEAQGDIAIISDMGRGYRVFEKFANLKSQTKIWYAILLTNEFEPMMVMDDTVKIASTNYFYRMFEEKKATNPVLMLGPMDNEEFYPLCDMRRSKIILIYAKKSSWVGPEVAKLVHNYDKSLVIGAMGLDSLGDKLKMMWESYKGPLVNFSTCSHLTQTLNYIYNLSMMYVELCGGANWGFNYMLGEAMRCKCPVICHDWEGFDHLVISGETALTIPFNHAPETLDGGSWMVRPNPMTVISKIIELNENEKLRENLVNNAYELVTKYSIQNWVNKFEEIIQ